MPAPRRPTLHALTGIRFVAAAMVLLFHFGAGFAARAHAPGPIVTFLSNGYLGVSLFFMLSGFIITYTYDGRLGAVGRYRDYAVARFSRIYPVYLLALLMMLPFAWGSLPPARAAMVLIMLQSWTVPGSSLGYTWLMQAWTLSVELFFYLCAPFILMRLRRLGMRGLIGLAVALALAIPAMWVPSIPPGTRALPYAWEASVPVPLLRTCEFLFGAILCKLFVAHPTRLARVATNPLIALNIVAIVGLIMASRHGTVVGVAMVLTGGLLVQLAAGDTFASRFLSRRLMVTLGASSYALYLIQAPVREYLRFLPSDTLGQLLNPFVAVGLSVLIYRLWEEPARRWLRDRLAPQTPPPVRQAVPDC